MRNVYSAPLRAAAAAVVVFSLSIQGQQPAPRDTSPRVLDVQGGKIRVVTVATGLFHPWSLAFADARTLLVAEKNGKLRMIRDGMLLPDNVWTSPTQGGDALHAVAIHPQFAQNNLVYMSYPKQGPQGTTLAVARGRLKDATLENVQEIFVADAWETGGNLAGRILLGPDTSLYVTVGDRDRICCNGTDDNSLRLKAQDLGNHTGKTLRLRDDGTGAAEQSFCRTRGSEARGFHLRSQERIRTRH